MITTVLASILGALFFKMTLAVVNQRKSLKIALGSGEDETLLQYTSAHNNFSQYVPMLLILFYLNEINAFLPKPILFVVAILIVMGRVLHYRALTAKKMSFKLRVRGMQLTLFPMMAMSISLVVNEGLKYFQK